MHKDGFQYFFKLHRNRKLDLDIPVPWICLESNRLRVSTAAYTPTWALAHEAHSLSANNPYPYIRLLFPYSVFSSAIPYEKPINPYACRHCNIAHQ